MAGDRALKHSSVEADYMDTPQEGRGGNARFIGGVVIGLVLLVASSLFIFNSVVRNLDVRANAAPAPVGEFNIDVNKVPQAPRLQDHAVQDLQQMHTAEDQVLNTYGWIDRKKGVARIPIDRAIDLLAQRGTTGRAGRRTPDHSATGLAAKVEQPADQLAAGTQTREGAAK